ncbi:Glyoxalase/bleomycin resistance protein/dioxygenase [Planctomycetales bacterium 10988]|nr:Glyoxalase/bleomycin resistance protein/dioxygenase [Planctomycetales bacterium 10988]
MTETSSNSSTPVETLKLIPHLVIREADKAIDFYQEAFGASEMMRLPGPDGKIMHATISISGAPIMIVEENTGCQMAGPKTLGGTPITIHLQVQNVDTFFQRAIDAGATEVIAVADMFWGDRYGVLEDPFGHRWSIATTQKSLSKEELLEAMKTCMEME